MESWWRNGGRHVVLYSARETRDVHIPARPVSVRILHWVENVYRVYPTRDNAYRLCGFKRRCATSFKHTPPLIHPPL